MQMSQTVPSGTDRRQQIPGEQHFVSTSGKSKCGLLVIRETKRTRGEASNLCFYRSSVLPRKPGTCETPSVLLHLSLLFFIAVKLTLSAQISG